MTRFHSSLRSLLSSHVVKEMLRSHVLKENFADHTLSYHHRIQAFPVTLIHDLT